MIDKSRAKQKFKVLQDLVSAVARFCEVSLAECSDESIDVMEKAINEREGSFVTQVETSYQVPLRVTVLLKQVVDGETTLTPLLLFEDMPPTLQ